MGIEAASNSEQERLEISEEVGRQLKEENTLKSYNGFFEIAIEEDSRILDELPFDSAPPQSNIADDFQELKIAEPEVSALSSGRVGFNTSGKAAVNGTPRLSTGLEQPPETHLGDFLQRPFENLQMPD